LTEFSRTEHKIKKRKPIGFVKKEIKFRNSSFNKSLGSKTDAKTKMISSVFYNDYIEERRRVSRRELKRSKLQKNKENIKT